jgi:hypothetical protein
MKRIAILSSLLAVCFVVAAQGQTAAPKPNPEIQKMSLFTGHWKFEAEVKPSPIGSAPGKIKEEWVGQMTLGGFFFERRVKGTRPEGDFEFLDIDWYDPATKSLTYALYLNNGDIESGLFEVTGNVSTVRRKVTAAGKEYQIRQTYTFAPDGMSMVYKTEYSPDGQTWTAVTEGKAVKVEPAAKK